MARGKLHGHLTYLMQQDDLSRSSTLSLLSAEWLVRHSRSLEYTFESCIVSFTFFKHSKFIMCESYPRMAIYRVCGSLYSNIPALSLSVADISFKPQHILTVYEISFTYHRSEICTACMHHGDSYEFQLEAISPCRSGSHPRVLRRWNGNILEIHLDRCLRRMSYTTLKHFIARTPHSGQAADVIAEF